MQALELNPGRPKEIPEGRAGSEQVSKMTWAFFLLLARLLIYVTAPFPTLPLKY